MKQKEGVFGWRARAGGSVTQQKGGFQIDEEQSLPTRLLQESLITWYILEYYHKASYRYVSFLLNSQASESQSRKSPVVNLIQPFLMWCWGGLSTGIVQQVASWADTQCPTIRM